MEVKVKLSHLRIAPRKTREVVDLVRGKTAAEAKSILSFAVKKAALPVLKLLNSGVAAATHDFHFEESNLYISQIFVDEGTRLKRWHPMSRGRAYPIEKRVSHITIILKEIKPTAEPGQEEKKPIVVKKNKEAKEVKTKKVTKTVKKPAKKATKK
jgi:large subunit ribosomal protein L22